MLLAGLEWSLVEDEVRRLFAGVAEGELKFDCEYLSGWFFTVEVVVVIIVVVVVVVDGDEDVFSQFSDPFSHDISIMHGFRVLSIDNLDENKDEDDNLILLLTDEIKLSAFSFLTDSLTEWCLGLFSRSLINLLSHPIDSPSTWILIEFAVEVTLDVDKAVGVQVIGVDFTPLNVELVEDSEEEEEDNEDDEREESEDEEEDEDEEDGEALEVLDEVVLESTALDCFCSKREKKKC